MTFSFRSCLFHLLLVAGFLGVVMLLMDYSISQYGQSNDGLGGGGGLGGQGGPWRPRHSQGRFNESSTVKMFTIPTVVHHMWKTGSKPPAECTRWREGCKRLNPAWKFSMYDDDDLQAFVSTHYPRYLSLYDTLSGVYMADMARVLLVYHYGGIYSDLDFYCTRPYRCLIKQAYSIIVSHQISARKALAKAAINKSNAETRSPVRERRTLQRQRRTQADTLAAPVVVTAAGPVAAEAPAVPDTPPQLIDVLVVSQETLMHSVLFHNKTRVVIQDFFMATPKHPFLLWLLEDRLAAFNSTTSSASPPAKGPFSYSIDKDLDAYHATPGRPSVVVELAPDVLHPMADATNSRYAAACAGVPGMSPALKERIAQLEEESDVDAGAGEVTGPEAGAEGRNQTQGLSLSEERVRACDSVSRGKFLHPSARTAGVHMWTHVYLALPSLRSLYNARTYRRTEAAIHPSPNCFDE